MIRRERNFTVKEKKLALLALVMAAAVTALSLSGVINARPSLGAYDGDDFSVPTGVMSAQPVKMG